MSGLEQMQAVAADAASLDAMIEQMRSDGQDWAAAKADYYAAKAQKVLELRTGGMAVGIVQDTVKGDPAVNLAMLKMDCAEANYRASREAVMARKMQIKLANEAANREWYA